MALLQIPISSSSSSTSMMRMGMRGGNGGSDYLSTTQMSPSSIITDHVRSSSSSSFRISRRNNKGGRRGSIVRSSLETTEPVVVVGTVTEVNKDTFWPLVKAACDTDKIVVLDMYTQWCGPCKVIAPRFKALAEKYLDVLFLKLDCNNENKPLAKELGIKVVPTFKILKDSKVVKEVTGAKIEDLTLAIENIRSS